MTPRVHNEGTRIARRRRSGVRYSIVYGMVVYSGWASDGADSSGADAVGGRPRSSMHTKPCDWSACTPLLPAMHLHPNSPPLPPLRAPALLDAAVALVGLLGRPLTLTVCLEQGPM